MDFAAQIAARFCERSALPDDTAFLERIDAALDRTQHRRRWVLSACGACGGLLTLFCLTQLEALAGVRTLFRPGLHLIADFTTASWSVSALVIALLLMPVLMRAVVDPK